MVLPPGLARCTCGATVERSAELQAHKVWLYEDAEHVARLAGVRLICKLWHAVERFGDNLLRMKEDSLYAFSAKRLETR